MERERTDLSDWEMWDEQYVWHPYTQMKGAKHLSVESAKGSQIKLKDGREIIDAVSSWWVNPHGHSHPYIAEKIHEQAQNLAHVIFAGFRHEPAARLAKTLADWLPGSLNRVFFSDNGSTAVEAALKMCIQAHYNEGKPKKTIVAFEGAYHGDTLGAISTSAQDTFFTAFKEYTFEIQRIPLPNAGNFKDCFEKFHSVLKDGDVAAFIYEPLVQGAAGMEIYSPFHLEQLIQLAKQWGAYCIADEVMTGFGRTGKTFASEYMETSPDVICLSKCLTGGALPMAITVGSDEIYEKFFSDEKQKMFFHGHSFTGNPIGCAASIASLELLKKQDCQDAIQRINRQHKAFSDRIKSHPKVTRLRMMGTILAFDWKIDEKTNYYAEIRDELYEFFLSKGVLLRPLGNIVYILPPYCISKEELEEVYSAIESALEKF